MEVLACASFQREARDPSAVRTLRDAPLIVAAFGCHDSCSLLDLSEALYILLKRSERYSSRPFDLDAGDLLAHHEGIHEGAAETHHLRRLLNGQKQFV
jgi:hypothetical protein